MHPCGDCSHHPLWFFFHGPWHGGACALSGLRVNRRSVPGNSNANVGAPSCGCSVFFFRGSSSCFYTFLFCCIVFWYSFVFVWWKYFAVSIAIVFSCAGYSQCPERHPCASPLACVFRTQPLL